MKKTQIRGRAVLRQPIDLARGGALHVLPLACVILLGLGLRALRLDFQPLWWDEGYSVWFATHPLGQMAALTAQDIHPPLYYALLRGWTLLFGTGPAALRLLSVVAGTLAVPVIYLAGRRLFDQRTALLAAFLLAINPLHIYYSQEVRMYGLVALFSAAALACAWPVLTAEQPRLRQMAPYVLVITAALYTQYYAVFLPIGLTLYAAWRWRRNIPALGRWLAAQALCAVLYLPWVLYAGLKLVSYVGGKVAADADRPLDLLPYLGRHLSAFLAGHLDGPLAPWWPAVLLLLGVVWGLGIRKQGVGSRERGVGNREQGIGSRVGEAHGGDTFVSRSGGVAEGDGAGRRSIPDRPRLSGERTIPDDGSVDKGGGVGACEHCRGEWPGDAEGLRQLPEHCEGLTGRSRDLPGAGGTAGLCDSDSHRAGAGAGDRDQQDAGRLTPEPIDSLTATPFSLFPAPYSLLITVLLTALLLGYAIGRRYPFFPVRGERLLLLALPVFTLLNAGVLAVLLRRVRWVGVLGVAAVAAVSGASLAGFYTIPRYPNDDYRSLIARTVEQGRPEDTVFCVYPWQVGYWRSYGGSNGPEAVLTPSAGWDSSVAAALDGALSRGHLWFPAHLTAGAILEGRIETYLGERARPFANQWFGPGTRLSAWYPAPGAGSDQVETALPLGPVRFAVPGAGQNLVLESVLAGRAAVPAANAVTPLTFRWRATGSLPRLGVSVRMVDALGQIWAQHDYEPVGGAATAGVSQTSATPAAGDWQAEDRIGLLVPAGTPPGDYQIEVIVRNAGDNRPLEVFGNDGKRLGLAAPLLSLTVQPAGRLLEPERLPVARRQVVDLGDGIRFLGYSTDDTAVTPGELRKVNLFWQATGRPAAEYVAVVQLLGAAGQPPLTNWEAPPGAAYPTTLWDPGTLMRTQTTFRPRADLPDGRYNLIAALYRRSDGQRLRSSSGVDHIDLGRVTIQGRAHTFTAPGPGHAASEQLGDLARLVGYDLPNPDIAPGSKLALTLHWQAQGTSERAYTVFVHLVGPDGVLRGTGDGEPGAGRFPTTGWVRGEYLADAHEVTVDGSAPPGTYRLVIGLYDPDTGQRLTTAGGSDQVQLDVPVQVH